MINGSLPAFSELKPRILIEDVAPGAPLLDVNCNPGTAPAKALVTLVTCDLLNCSESTTLAEPVNADFFAVPKATTNTSSNNSESGTSSTLIFALTGNSC